MDEVKLGTDNTLDVSRFLNLAKENNWDEFDKLAKAASKNPAYLKWTIIGITDPNINTRDLAITLLENTTLPEFEERIEVLNKTRDSDENPHLRRKAAIALFRHGIETPENIKILEEAYDNDVELRDHVGKLLQK